MPHWTQDQILFVGEIAGGFISAIGLVVVVFTYLRNEMWNRAEFLAREMKEFFGSTRVQKALVLIDRANAVSIYSKATLPVVRALP